MSDKEGLIIFFDEERRKDIIEERSSGGYAPFSDALSVYDWDIKQNCLALLSFSKTTIDYICLASKGKRVATSKSRVDFSELVNLGGVRVSEIESKIGPNFKKHFISSTQGYGGKVPEKTWANILDVISDLRPGVKSEIARLLSLGRYSGYRLRGQAAEVLLQEREAIGISLEIFSGNNKLRDTVLRTWAPGEGQVKNIDELGKEGTLAVPEKTKSCFLRGVSSRYIQEESALQHDLFNWDGMTPFHESGVSVFESGSRRLEIVYANRNSLEHTLGVDLIYHNAIYNSFVLLQYKLMRQDGEEADFYYRPDNQLRDELKRMEEFLSNHPVCENKKHEDFRLCSDCFLLKLVPNRGLQPASGELIKGMYLTKGYVDFLLSEYGPKGKYGAEIITFKNSPRYLTNVEFAQLVNRGWIGTSGVTSEFLKLLVRNFYESGRAILFSQEVACG